MVGAFSGKPLIAESEHPISSLDQFDWSFYVFLGRGQMRVAVTQAPLYPHQSFRLLLQFGNGSKQAFILKIAKYSFFLVRIILFDRLLLFGQLVNMKQLVTDQLLRINRLQT